MSKPRLLDLFCGAGGAAMGYSRAGFEVVGVDIKSQPHYPFEFILGDVMDLYPADLAGYDALHASPPCQQFTRARHLRDAQRAKTDALNLIEVVRTVLRASGIPYVIENVPGAPLIDPVTVCGSSFGLRVRRHRLFESTVPLHGSVCDHKAQGRPVGVYHVMGDDIPHGGRTARDLADGQDAMGIDWMEWGELKEAVPPAFTEFIGRQLIDYLASVKS